MSSRVAAAVLALALAGCDSRSLVVGEGPGSASLGGGVIAAEQRCPDSAVARASNQDCWPTRHVGRWRGFVTGDARYRHVLAESLEFPSDEVLLEVGEQGTGTLLFASGRACVEDAGVGAQLDASDAGSSSCSSSEADAADRPRPGLLLDYRYPLDGLNMSGAAQDERTQDPAMAFSLLIAAPWRDECSRASSDLAPAPCRCDAAGCTASPETLLVSLSLSRDRQALRGSIISSADTALVAGLELVRQ